MRNPDLLTAAAFLLPAVPMLAVLHCSTLCPAMPFPSLAVLETAFQSQHPHHYNSFIYFYSPVSQLVTTIV